MATKRSSPLDEPPPVASSSSETSSGTSSETSSEEETVSRNGSSSVKGEDEEQTLALTQSPIPKNPSSDADTEVDSGRNVKPIASKPMNETPMVIKPKSEPCTSASPAKSSLKKDSVTTRDAKRLKKSSEADEGAVTEKSKLFQRLWSEDDEIAILEGMIDFSAKKNMYYSLDMNAFRDFIKKSLHFDGTMAQLMDKIRRLKLKYRNNVDRGKGADPTFSKPHEQKGFELSKKIWGDEGICRTPAVELMNSNANGPPKKNQRGGTGKSPALLKAELLSPPDAPKEDDKMKVDGREAPSGCIDGFIAFERTMGAVGLPESFLKPGFELIAQSKRTELEEEWKKLHVAELEHFVKRTELVRDQAKLILEAYKSSDK